MSDEQVPQGAPSSSAPASGDPNGQDPTGPGSATPERAGLARAMLDAARVRRPGSRRSAPATRRGPRGYSGPGPDPRDPQSLADVLSGLVKVRGWQRSAAEATIFGAWERVVGPDVAGHCRPVKLERGELTIEAESTAWATQLRLLAARLLAGIAGQVGDNVVTRLNIHGPAGPSWAHGLRRVRGRGPRDTYG